MENQKRRWLPESKEGRQAIIISALAVAWGILMPVITFGPIRIAGLEFFLLGGFERVLMELVLAVLGFYYLYKAIFKIKDRAWLVMILFAFFCLIAGFWILFAIGEVLFPH